MADLSRRNFSKTAGVVTAASYARILGANDRVQLGYIGVGNRGTQVHEAFLEHGDQITVALCDLRDDYMEHNAKLSRGSPKLYREYRKLLEDNQVQAVVIATPDHWHALQFIDACQAGKDVYVEKPLSLTVQEGRRMVDVAQETKRVTQVGIHRRSAKFLQEAVEVVRSGLLGPVTVCKGWHLQNEWPKGIGNPPDEKPVSEAEWDQWLGPAPKVPYNKNRTYYRFRWFYDYSGGQLTNFGVHYMDMLRWAIGKDAPTAVTAMGGKYAIQDNREIPDTLEALWEFEGGPLMVFSQYNANSAPGNLQGAEMEIRGTKGTMYIHSNRWEVIPERYTDLEVPVRSPLNRDAERSYRPSMRTSIEPLSGKGSASTAFHTRNFLDCVKSRARTNCDVLEGHRSTAATLIAKIALRLRAYLEWDSKAERFTNNAAANRYLGYQYRAPYKLG
ncbi:MAG: Gfo/Idh/MocA family oxidoreductase [Bryobacteraceae bacterium]|nr:Gfo/Idh/MocA family oxidoreductase [Bryobacteraceae bacterium]MDW8377233.1 Gfo/Idh/MocA family oxidoreductase [Bryobacterales bacterium]